MRTQFTFRLISTLWIRPLRPRPVRKLKGRSHPVACLRHTLTSYPLLLGTPETGGWSTRELRTIVRGLKGINLVAADIVEVAPAYDTNAELTTMAAADTLYEVMSLMVLNGPLTKTEAVEAKMEV